jgi:cytosine permease
MAALPSYVAEAKPVPLTNRAPWYKTTAQTYAGIMLWFVFWHEVPVGAVLNIGGAPTPYSLFAGGTLAQGLGVAFIGLIAAALICHFLFYLVPGLLGMRTGLPLYIVGTSTYGVTGGFIMPGFLMGLLQFGWLAVNAFFSAWLLCAPFGYGPGNWQHGVVATVWAIAAAFMGLRGIQYVARVATFLPLIPIVILLILAAKTMGGVAEFDSQALVGAYTGEKFTDALPHLSTFGVIALLSTYIVGFFATAGAAGTDIASNNRDARDVQLGGLVGVAGATIFAGGLSLLIVAGAHGMNLTANDPAAVQTSSLMNLIVGEKTGGVFMYLLAIAAFPPACFSAFIAANSFKTTLPQVNPYVSVGLGTLAAIVLAVTGIAGQAVVVFTVIGASFGPICGAMVADYLLAGRRWPGPRAGFNPAGWISWAVGFAVGSVNIVAANVPQLAVLEGKIPAPPVAAFIVGFVLYALLAKLGMQSRSLPMPANTQTD